MMYVHLRLIAKLKKKWVRKIHVHVNIQNLWWSLCDLVIILQKKPCWWAISLLYCIGHQIDDLFEKKVLPNVFFTHHCYQNGHSSECKKLGNWYWTIRTIQCKNGEGHMTTVFIMPMMSFFDNISPCETNMSSHYNYIIL